MMEKEMRESTLARILPNLSKEQINKVVKRHKSKFTPKYRAFSILQNKMDDVVQKTTREWKSLYNTTEDVLEEEYREQASTKPKEGRKWKGGKIEMKKKVEEEESRDKNIEIQQEQSVEVTQPQPPSPPHSTDILAETIQIKDVVVTSSQDIDPLTVEDLTKILDQSTHQAQLCTNPILFSIKNSKSQ